MLVNVDDVLTETVIASESDQISSTEIPDTEATHSTTLQESAMSTEQILDIGEIYAGSASPTEFTRAMQSLTAAQKYALLTKHRVPSKNHVFPFQHLGGCNRSFRYAWLEENPWLVYSEHHVLYFLCYFLQGFFKRLPCK